MRLISLELENFLSYKSDTIELDQLDYAAITGPNGAGKSTIVAAITWALFGKLPVVGDHDSVVNDEEEHARVTLEVDDHGDRWRIVRTRYYQSSGEVRLLVLQDGDWTPYGDHLNATAERQISNLLGMSEDAFYSLALMDQSSTAGGTRFTKAKSPERREILLGLLPELDRYGELEARARERLNATVRSLDRAENERELIEARAEEADQRRTSLVDAAADEEAATDEVERLGETIGKLQTELGALSSGKQRILAELEAEQAKYERNVHAINGELSDYRKRARRAARHDEAVDEARRAVEAAERRLPSVELEATEAAEAATAADRALPELRATRDRRAERREELAAQRSAVAAQLDDARERTSLLEAQEGGGRCYVCESKLTEARVDDLLHTVHQRRDDLASQLDDLDDRLETLRTKLRDADREIETADQTARRAGKAAERARAAEAEARRDLTDARARLDDLQREESDDAAELDDLAASAESDLATVESKWRATESDFRDRIAEAEGSAEADRVSGELVELKAAREAAQKRANAAGRARGALTELEESATSMRRDVQRLRKEIKTGRAEEKRLSWMVAALGPKGIPSMLLDSVLSSIETRQNEILASLPGTEQFQVEFRQTKELKSRAGSKSVLDIIVHTPNGKERPIESFSFGERVRLTISNLFAMVQVFNERRPGMVETLFLDEPLGPLDENSIPAFVEVLRSAMQRDIVSSILVVTHDQRVIDALPQRVSIERTDEGSKTVVLS